MIRPVNRTSVCELLGMLRCGAVGVAQRLRRRHAPDIVGNVRVDQAWGLFQISAAAHEVNASYNVLGCRRRSDRSVGNHRPPRRKWGGAVMAALQIKNIPTGAGDDIKIDASYAKGATKYVISTTAGFAELRDVRRYRRAVLPERRLRCDTDGVYFPVATAAPASS